MTFEQHTIIFFEPSFFMILLTKLINIKANLRNSVIETLREVGTVYISISVPLKFRPFEISFLKLPLTQVRTPEKILPCTKMSQSALEPQLDHSMSCALPTVSVSH